MRSVRAPVRWHVPLALAAQAKSPPRMFAIALAGLVIGFLAGTPYAVITRDKFLAGLTGLQAHLASGHGTDEGLGWSHHLTFSLRFGVGMPFLAAALGGMVWLGATDRRRQRAAVALDRLLAQRDSRSIAADDIRARFPQGASVYQNGAVYGQPQLWPEGIFPVMPVERGPRLVILQTSRLVAYSGEPDGLRASLAQRYRLLRRIEVEDPTRAATPVFDQQDAFFLPLTGFERFIRPGPAIEIFERVDD